MPAIRSLLVTLVTLILAIPTTTALPGLPAGVDGDAMAERLGFLPGERHPHHHELLAFYRDLAERHDRVAIETIGRTHGGREHILLYFTDPGHIEDIERFRAGRIEASRAGDGPPVIWLGYSVHGNEASGASAAAAMAWYLATSDDEQVQRWLAEAVIVMEPVINPDGLDRFAHWVNMHRGRNPSADPNDREHNEAWPNGRTSYYWFDLNRDWMPVTHPVSRQRIAEYARWRPHVVTDAHEMGHRSSYFFQPGIPERNNPATPQRVFDLTARIARYHGEILDAAGQPYYSRESFDDYYLGKGSTYPDLTGGIGILFEQGSARGHRMDTPFGERTFAEAIANQVRTSISTLNAATDLGDALIDHQRRFFSEAREAGGGGWLLGDDGDPMRARRLLETLLVHGIEIRAVDSAVSLGGTEYRPGSVWAIPADQDQYRFIQALFATPTELPMETFYDVSAWPLQHAFDLPLERRDRLPEPGARLTDDALPDVEPASVATDPVAWAIDWRQHHAPALLAALLADGYRVQGLSEPARLAGIDEPVELGRGSILVHTGIQPEHLSPVGETLPALAAQHRVDITPVVRGLAVDGIDLGSPSAEVMQAPRPLLLAGDGVSGYGAGYVWRWFDVHVDQPVTRVAPDDLPDDLDDYTHIIAPPGRYAGMHDSFGDSLAEFVRDGGQLIALGSAASWVEELDLGWSFVADEESDDEQDTPEARRYADHETDFARTLIGGSALGVELDPTHPLAWGYTREAVTLFRQGAHVLRATTNAYATPGRYAQPPLVAGYLSDKVAEQLAGSPALAADRLGDGLVVRIADDVLFRGYWAGAERLFANAVYHGQAIGSTRMPD